MHPEEDRRGLRMDEDESWPERQSEDVAVGAESLEGPTLRSSHPFNLAPIGKNSCRWPAEIVDVDHSPTASDGSRSPSLRTPCTSSAPPAHPSPCRARSSSIPGDPRTPRRRRWRTSSRMVSAWQLEQHMQLPARQRRQRVFAVVQPRRGSSCPPHDRPCSRGARNGSTLFASTPLRHATGAHLRRHGATFHGAHQSLSQRARSRSAMTSRTPLMLLAF